MLERLFRIRELGSNPRTEVAAGVTTFLTMSYIIFVNPAVLSQTGMDFGAVLVATCLAAAVGTLIMGLWARYPIALAPGMGENFFFLGAVLAMGITWQQGLTAVFMSGVLFLILGIFKVREMVIDGIPESLRYGVAAGIGLFIVMIGLVYGGIVIRHPISPLVPVKLGDLSNPATQTALVGLIFTLILLARKIRGAILIGILGTAIFGLARGVVEYQGIFSAPPSLKPTFLQLDLNSFLTLNFWSVVLIFLYMDLFDSIGTLIGVGEQAGFLEKGRLPRASRALASDATATMLGATLGTSTVTAYIESAAGVQTGGRTGFASVITAGLFLVALFFAPLASTIGGGYQVAPDLYFYPVVAPAMILVGSLMARALARIPWDDVAQALPGFLAAIMIPLTYSIADGIAIGFVSYPIVMLCSGRGGEVKPLTYLLGLLFVLRYLFLAQ